MGFGNLLYSRCNIDTISNQIIARDDDVREVDANTQMQPNSRTRDDFVGTDLFLNLDTGPNRVHWAGKLRKRRIASLIEDAPAETTYCLGNKCVALTQLFRRSLFGGFHFSRIAHHVGGENRNETALHVPSLHRVQSLAYRVVRPQRWTLRSIVALRQAESGYFSGTNVRFWPTADMGVCVAHVCS